MKDFLKAGGQTEGLGDDLNISLFFPFSGADAIFLEHGEIAHVFSLETNM